MSEATAEKTETAVTVTKPKAVLKPIETVRAELERMKGQFAMVLPKHITPERLLRVALTAVQQTPKLLDCDRKSLYSAIMRSAQLGLEPDGILGQAYLIPYGNTVQFIPGYKGLIDLARRSGEVVNIIAKEVYAEDEFAVDFAKDIPFTHKPKLDGKRDPKDVLYFWAMARFKDGGFHWDYLTRQEVEQIRDRSSGKNNAVWRDHFIEMGKKTAIRRIAKYLPMSVQKAALLNDLVDSGKKFEYNEFNEIVVESEPEQAEDTKKTGNEAVKEKLTKKSKKSDVTDVDPETGEITSDPTPSPAPTEDQGPALPALETSQEARAAGEALIVALKAAPVSGVTSLFAHSHGMAIVEALRKFGDGLIIGRITQLGIKLPE